MINWYRTGKDPAREMIRLTTYLGHTDPDNTFWYLEAVPELLDLAMARATSNLLRAPRVSSDAWRAAREARPTASMISAA